MHRTAFRKNTDQIIDSETVVDHREEPPVLFELQTWFIGVIRYGVDCTSVDKIHFVCGVLKFSEIRHKISNLNKHAKKDPPGAD